VTDPLELRRAIGHFPTGVTVITSRGESGEPVGTTANAVASLSLAPPQVLVCLVRDSATLHALRSKGSFAINVLAEHQLELSGNFARRGGEASWSGVLHRHGKTGSPVLHGSLASLECTVDRILDGGDHEIVIGDVLNAQTTRQTAVQPLVFWRGDYAALAEFAQTSPAPAPLDRAPELAAAGCQLPTGAGLFTATGEGEGADGSVTLTLIHGDPQTWAGPIVRHHTHCLLGDTFGSLLCDCRELLDRAIEEIVTAGAGVLIYTKHAGSIACPAIGWGDGTGRPEAVGAEVALVRAELAAVEPRADPLRARAA
jgi:flavin reductase (DIM6/NTAB) family NADH-FMN oxidoreductase RutF